MIGYSSVTSKGQVTLPAGIRDSLGIKPYQRVVMWLEEDGVKVKHLPDLAALAGSLAPFVKTKKRYDKRGVDRAVGGLLAGRYRG